MIKRIRRRAGWRYRASYKRGNDRTVQLGTYDTQAEAVAAVNQAKRHHGVNDGTSSIGMGPLAFDVEQARVGSWTHEQIDRLWIRLTAAYRRVHAEVIRAHPELYARSKSDGTLIYIGPTPDVPALKMSSMKDLLEPLKPRRRRR